MDGAKLQDLLHKSCGVAGRRIGGYFDVYRPRGAMQPVAPENKIIRLKAAFLPTSGGRRFEAALAPALRVGVFDGFYTQPGDYFANRQQTFFVAQQESLLPVICVLTNTIVNIARVGPAQSGTYNGNVAGLTPDILYQWPAYVHALRATGNGKAQETRFGAWFILMPLLPCAPQVSDVISDSAGRTFATEAAEQTEAGWRLLARQIAG